MKSTAVMTSHDSLIGNDESKLVVYIKSCSDGFTVVFKLCFAIIVWNKLSSLCFIGIRC